MRSYEQLHEQIGSFSDNTTTLYVPRPVVQVGGEKFRILKKNLIDELEQHAPHAKKIAQSIEDLELQSFTGNGLVLFEDDEHQKYSFLSRRPKSLLMTGQRPFVLPLATDLLSHVNHWAVAVNKDAPKLYFFDGTTISDFSDLLEGPTYDDIETRREVQDDIFFHSSARGKASGQASTFHALGTDTSDEREKTDDVFYQELIDSVFSALPFQVTELHVFGGPKTRGRFTQLVNSDHIDIVSHEGAGEGQSAEEIAVTLGKLKSESDEQRELITENLAAAADRGQIETLFLGDESTFFIGGDAQNERLQVEVNTPEDATLENNRVLMAALKNGARVEPFPGFDNMSGGWSKLAATFRWNDETDAA